MSGDRRVQPYVAFDVRFADERADEVTALLWEMGTSGVEEKSPGVVLAYFPADRADEIAQGLAAQAFLKASRAEIPDVDWVARFREHFRAFDAGGFHVQPDWDESPASAETLVVDPGRAFGTGTHETTRLCLAALRELVAERPLGRVLDYGAGTGLLGVAAARLGASFVLGVDIDPEATAATRVHARLNHEPVHALLADGGAALVPAAFDTVVANVTAPLLVARRDEIVGLRKAGGRIVLSGILWDEIDTVRAAYAHAGGVQTRRDGEWGALVVG